MSETAMLLMRRPAELNTLVEEQQQRSTKKVGQQRRYAPKTRTGNYPLVASCILIRRRGHFLMFDPQAV